MYAVFFISAFWYSDLFRISKFGFRIFTEGVNFNG